MDILFRLVCSLSRIATHVGIIATLMVTIAIHVATSLPFWFSKLAAESETASVLAAIFTARYC
jgi:hypothetical protein